MKAAALALLGLVLAVPTLAHDPPAEELVLPVIGRPLSRWLATQAAVPMSKSTCPSPAARLLVVVTYSISVNPSSLSSGSAMYCGASQMVGMRDSRSRVVSGGGSFAAAGPGRQTPAAVSAPRPVKVRRRSNRYRITLSLRIRGFRPATPASIRRGSASRYRSR